MYSDWNTRKRILDGELKYEPDSYTSIAELHGYKGKDEDMLNKYEYNPLTGEFTIDQINNEDDRADVEAAVRALDFKSVVPQLVIKPIIHPFRDVPPPDTITDKHKELLKKWASVGDSVRYSVVDSVGDSVRYSVRDSVWDSVWDSVRDSVWYSVRASVRDSVRDSVWDSVRASVRDSVWDSVWDSMWAYISSFFALDKWERVKHEPGENPFQPGIDLWEMGLVPSFDGKKWRLHGGPDGRVLYEEEIV
jgi:hypothetical protein